VLNLPPRRASLLATGALMLAIGAMVFAFVVGTTHNADAQLPRTSSPWIQPRASTFYWAAQTGTFGPLASSVTATCDAGYVVESGGYRSYANKDQLNIYISAPADVNRGWEIRGSSTAQVAILVYARCIKF
jgi:hypothetical protein